MSMSISLYTCLCLYVYTRVYTHVYTHVYAHAYIHGSQVAAQRARLGSTVEQHGSLDINIKRFDHAWVATRASVKVHRDEEPEKAAMRYCSSRCQ